MSRIQTRQPVHSKVRQAAIRQELSRHRAGELVEAMGDRLVAVPQMRQLVGGTTSLGELVAGVGELPQVPAGLALDAVGAHLEVLTRQAAAAHLDTTPLRQAAREVEELRRNAEQASADAGAASGAVQPVLVGLAEVCHVADALESRMVKAVVEQRTHEAVLAAATRTLRRMGLDDIARTTVGDGVPVVTGRSSNGDAVVVRVAGDPPSVEGDFVVPGDAVHPLDPHAGDRCEPATEMAARFHLILQEEAVRDGVSFDRVEGSSSRVIRQRRAGRGAGDEASTREMGR